MGANGQEYPVELAPQLIKGEIPSQPLAQAELSPQLPDHVDFRIENRVRQPKRRNAVAQHPARLRVRIKKHRGMTPPEQMMRRRQPRRAGPDNGDALARRGRRPACPFRFDHTIGLGNRRHAPPGVGREPMQVADRKRLLHLALPAALLAQPRTDPSQ